MRERERKKLQVKSSFLSIITVQQKWVPPIVVIPCYTVVPLKYSHGFHVLAVYGRKNVLKQFANMLGLDLIPPKPKLAKVIKNSLFIGWMEGLYANIVAGLVGIIVPMYVIICSNHYK